ncbi:hypothetical protein PGIGA_G00132130, partial [Pangasianodon gigas]|nr:hypothetical protein [Pangasianodon gigas]
MRKVILSKEARGIFMYTGPKTALKLPCETLGCFLQKSEVSPEVIFQWCYFVSFYKMAGACTLW